jgi:hypothetical protein
MCIAHLKLARAHQNDEGWKDGTRRANQFCCMPDTFAVVQCLRQKYFCFTETKLRLYSLCPVPPKGAARDRHETRGGMRWTRKMLLTRAFAADGEVVRS